MQELKITQNEEESRFETYVEGHLSVIEYRKTGKRIAYTHTEVAKEIRGRGIAGKLSKYALEYARKQELSVLPYCPYLAAYIKKHPEYQELVDDHYKEDHK